MTVLRILDAAIQFRPVIPDFLLPVSGILSISLTRPGIPIIFADRISLDIDGIRRGRSPVSRRRRVCQKYVDPEIENPVSTHRLIRVLLAPTCRLQQTAKGQEGDDVSTGPHNTVILENPAGAFQIKAEPPQEGGG